MSGDDTVSGNHTVSGDHTASGDTMDSRIRPFTFGWRTGVFRGRLWAWSWLLWTVFFLMPISTGWFLRIAFDRLERNEGIADVLVAIAVSEAVRDIAFAAAIWFVVRWWVAAQTHMRTNMLEAQTVSGGPKAATLPASPAEATTRFQDDTRDAVLWTDSWLDGGANLAYAVVAFAIMASIDGRAAFMVLLPMIAVAVIAQLLTPKLHAARAADRDAASRVASFMGESFAGLMALRMAGREEAAITRLERHTDHRRRTAVRDTVLDQTIRGVSSTSGDVAIGLALLVLVPRVRSGEFGVGDMALFVTYATQLGEVPRFLARVITARAQAKVAYRRMGELLPEGRIDDLLAPTHVSIEDYEEPRRPEPDPARRPLEALALDGVSVRYGDGPLVLDDIDLEVPRGAFVVVTGGVGSGKSTLLRALVGLVPLSAGELRWNGERIDDPAAWFVPPQSAHLPQIPKLFSESLADNIVLGRSAERLQDVLELTRLTADLREMPDGTDTVVGARGLRLSGGQMQRVATARALITEPELLVVDDISSALDVATERELWDRLAADGTSTVVAVSHRQLAFDRADLVVTLDAGRIVDVATANTSQR